MEQCWEAPAPLCLSAFHTEQLPVIQAQGRDVQQGTGMYSRSQGCTVSHRDVLQGTAGRDVQEAREKVEVKEMYNKLYQGCTACKAQQNGEYIWPGRSRRHGQKKIILSDLKPKSFNSQSCDWKRLLRYEIEYIYHGNRLAK